MTFRYQKPDIYQGKIWGETFPGNKTVSKMTMGVAVMTTPFFLVAHLAAYMTGFPVDGYSMPYRIMLVFTGLFFTGLGLILLGSLLRKYFEPLLVAITILAIGLGTNLYYYSTIEAPISHACSFFLFSLFLYSVDSWTGSGRWKHALLAGLSLGLIVLVRPTNGIIFILIPLWKVASMQDLAARTAFFRRNWVQCAAIFLLIVLVFSPQLLYWKYITGQYFYYAYGQERFFFKDPAFLQGMFSYRKGWLVYTPVMIFALAGFIPLFKSNKGLFWPVILFILLHYYIIWSWWCWWYGGGFGQRALVESYAVLALPFAAMIQRVLAARKLLRYLSLIILLALVSLNIFQSFQYTKGIIHWDSMSRNAYWRLYFRTDVSPALYEQIEPPDYDAALNGDRY
jgi:hypothetical protein